MSVFRLNGLLFYFILKRTPQASIDQVSWNEADFLPSFRDTLQQMAIEKTVLILRLEAEDHHFNVNQIDYPFTVIPLQLE